jgi:hypothetical protein
MIAYQPGKRCQIVIKYSIFDKKGVFRPVPWMGSVWGIGEPSALVLLRWFFVIPGKDPGSRII